MFCAFYFYWNEATGSRLRLVRILCQIFLTTNNQNLTANGKGSDMSAGFFSTHRSAEVTSCNADRGPISQDSSISPVLIFTDSLPGGGYVICRPRTLAKGVKT